MRRHVVSDEFMVELTSCQPRLYGFILKRTADHEQARDILQETNLVLCRKAHEYRDGSNFIAWAFRTAHYQVLAFRQKKGRERLVFDNELLAELHAAEDEDRAARELQTRQQFLEACLQKLKVQHRQLIARRYSGVESVQDIARELGTTANAVSKVLHRSRQSLMKCVGRKMAALEA